MAFLYWKKLEKILQELALRFVYDDYSSSSDTLLENAKVPTRQVRHIRTMALETYKILHKVLQQLLCGIAYQTTSGLKIVSHILGSLFSPGLVLMAVALLANKKPNFFSCLNLSVSTDSLCLKVLVSKEFASDSRSMFWFFFFFYKYFRSLSLSFKKIMKIFNFFKMFKFLFFKWC